MPSFSGAAFATVGSTVASCALAIQVEKYAHRGLYWLAPEKFSQLDYVPYGLTESQIDDVRRVFGRDRQTGRPLCTLSELKVQQDLQQMQKEQGQHPWNQHSVSSSFLSRRHTEPPPSTLQSTSTSTAFKNLNGGNEFEMDLATTTNTLPLSLTPSSASAGVASLTTATPTGNDAFRNEVMSAAFG